MLLVFFFCSLLYFVLLWHPATSSALPAWLTGNLCILPKKGNCGCLHGLALLSWATSACLLVRKSPLVFDRLFLTTKSTKSSSQRTTVSTLTPTPPTYLVTSSVAKRAHGAENLNCPKPTIHNLQAESPAILAAARGQEKLRGLWRHYYKEASLCRALG